MARSVQVPPEAGPAAESPVPPAGRMRRDPRQARSGGGPAPAPAPDGPPVRRIADPACLILALPQLDAGRLSGAGAGLLGAARQLADRLSGAVAAAVALQPGECLRFDPGATGIDRLVRMPDGCLSGGDPAARLAAVTALVRTLEPRHILLTDAGEGAGLGRRLAARLGDRAATGVVRLGSDHLISLAPGGRELRRVPPRVILIAPDAFAPPPAIPAAEALPLAAPDWSPPSNGIEDLGLLPSDSAGLPLGEAELIVAGGAGMTDWATFHALSRVLGAAEAGSRVACDAGHLPRDRQVGASGMPVAPRAYLAFGISGAQQHLDGIARCPRVIAVNTDPHCAMLKRADLGLIADAAAVAAALVLRLKEDG